MKPDLRTIFSRYQDEMVRLTGELAALESPTDDKAAVDRMGERVAAELKGLGADLVIHPRAEVGDIVEARWHADRPGRPLLIVSHMDTVHPVGAIAQNPVRVEEGRLYGPGTYDMKGSIVAVLAAVRGLQEAGLFPERPITALMTTDEETGSVHSRKLIEARAAGAALTLVMESALPDGALKTWRKSVGHFVIRAYGIASHAGGAHENGLNAIEEMANHILALQRMTDYKVGTTINVGVVYGGTRSNVVPDLCELHVDARAMTGDEVERVTSAIHALQPVMPGARIEIEGGFDRPPMERNALMIETFERARQIAARYGLTLREGGSGGASDANYTAALGVPTLDGIGPQGDGAHSEREHILLSALPKSATLIGALLLDWPAD